MRILIFGSGGREHSLIWKLSQNKRISKIFCMLGNPGIAKLAECHNIDLNDNKAIGSFAINQKIDLTIVGPEQQLVNGIVDFFQERGLNIFGPSKAAAQIEGSKEFAKNLMKKYQIPTADYAVFTEAAAAKKYIQAKGTPIVIKADGLAAGKGVIVANSINEAFDAIDSMLITETFGKAGLCIVVEEFLIGEEASVLAFTDGHTVVPMLAAQDHKRVFDNDQGPNTGGMGTYAPAPVMTAALLEQVTVKVLQPAVDALNKEGCKYIGCLYAGLMITSEGPKVIEFNARFGDPETQVLMPLLETDLLDIFEACVAGNLQDIDVTWSNKAAVCVIMAAGGYPDSYSKGDTIKGIEEAEKLGAIIFHAGTALDKGKYVVNGGRVLGVTAVGESIANAIKDTYQAVKCIDFNNCHYRKDIGLRALDRE